MKFNSYKPLRLIELFAGIGAQAKALRNLGIEFEHWLACDFDKYAIQSYNVVHGTNFNPSDITKLTASDLNITNTDHYNYLLTYSFPCQDLSNAGKGRGMEKGSGTRSGLLWEVERLLNECTELPQVLLMENVPQVHGKKNMEHFEKWIDFLESKGYSNFWTDLNAKNYGIPQSRNRCYMVSVLGEYSYEFPEPIPLTLNLGDMLEKDVDEKYYLSKKAIEGRQNTKFNQYKLESRIVSDKDIHPTILARYDGAPTLVDETPTHSTSELKSKLCEELLDKGLVEEGDVIRHSYTSNRLNNGVENMGRTESKEKLSPTLDTRCDCLGVVVKEPSELQKEVCNRAIESGLMTPYDIIGYTYSNARLSEIMNGKLRVENKSNNQISNTIRCTVENMGVCVPGEIAPKVVGGIGEKKSNGGKQWYQQDRIYDDKVAISVTTAFNPYYATNQSQELRIRKLTPKECWRLMGFADEDVEKAAKVCSNAQLYKQAGNSIVVNVLMAIFKELFVPKQTRSQWLDELLGGV